MTRPAPTSFAYIETTLAPGTTIDEYRRSRPARPGRVRRLIGALRRP
ncbi:MAG TPA: hypothetical protein VF520_16295 [Thermoleophilaceae bacterium]|jgi:hypothetical protein